MATSVKPVTSLVNFQSLAQLNSPVNVEENSLEHVMGAAGSSFRQRR